jgi:hypothetical protein
VKREARKSEALVLKNRKRGRTRARMREANTVIK